MTPCGAIVTANVQRQLAEKLRDAARANCRTISGEIRAMLLDRFGQELD
jgi:hypothetical protein